MDLNWAFAHFQAVLPQYDIFHNYYYGRHEMFYGRIQKYPNLDKLIKKTRSNVCKTVVDIISSRLELIGIDCPHKEHQDEINKIFYNNRVMSLAKMVHKQCLISGDSYISAWKEPNGDISIFVEPPENVAVHYDVDNNIDMVVKYKIFTDLENNDKMKVWVYLKDKILSGIVDGDSYACLPNFEPDTETPNVFGEIPFYHFSNGIFPTEFARSDIEEIIPLQNNLNKTLQDRAIASELSAFGQKYATGITYEVDETGKRVDPFQSDIAKIWMTSDPEAKFGEFSATELENYTGVIDSLHNEIACVSQIPMHLFNLTHGEFPSGEALKAAESPLVAKLNDKQTAFGDQWENLFQNILRLQGIDEKYLSAVWKDTQPHSEMEQWQISTIKHALGMPVEQIFAEQGYNEKQINSFEQTIKDAETNFYNNVALDNQLKQENDK